MTATRDAVGTASLRSWSRFALISASMIVTPVTFLPGRPRLETRPLPRASALLAITIGMVEVACMAARMASVTSATMTSGLRLTSSAAKAGKRLSPPSWYRQSMTRFCPST
jgi:hypothetical protein